MSLKIPKILIIAGSDSGGGAGIQADIKAITHFKAYSMTAITAVTAQNTLGVQYIHSVPINVLEAQIDSVISDLSPDVVKIGMLGTIEVVDLVSSKIDSFQTILDPVMVATSGDKLLEDNCINSIKKSLLPLAYLVTPNSYEAEILTGISIKNINDQTKAAKKLQELGAKNVLIKGGHVTSNETVVDLLLTENEEIIINESKRINSKNTHGTGCTLASAIAAQIGHKMSIQDAVRSSIEYVQKSILNAPNFGSGNGPLRHFHD